MIKTKFYISTIAITLIVLIAINFAGSKLYKRFDLTKDKRYTLSESALQTIANVDSPLIIDMFLEGEFPSEFRRLQTETKQIFNEFALYNNHIKINYINPLADEATRDRNIQQLTQSGLEPYVNSNKTSGKITQELIFPWAFASYLGQTVKIPLLKRNITTSLQDQITNSIQNLEYTFADGFRKITKAKQQKIAILKGNGQLNDLYVADFLQALKSYYNLAPFTLDSVASNPQNTLKQLKQYDLIISAKPTEAFTEEEKLVLDQFTMNGGKSLWLTESIIMDKDSLYSNSGTSVAIMRDLNLNDFFFKYGIRINPVIVSDMYSAPISLAIGEGSQAQIQPIQWQYSPLAASNPNHSITKNLNLVKFDFASQIDTLKNNVDKTILLQSSKLSKLQGVPMQISLDVVTQKPDKKTFNKGSQNLAVLLEGNFTSVYKNRVKPFNSSNLKDESINTKMIVIADGDVIKNDVIKNKAQELGFDRWTGQAFGNKEFLLNSVNYLLDDSGLIDIRTKDIAVPFLDSEKIEKEKGKWQLINILLPLILLAIFGFGFNYYRKKKYT